MSLLDVVGWVATVSGTVLGLPQMLRLIRTGRVEGLSLTAWQAMLVVNVAWTAHGISIGQLPQILTSALSLCTTVPILYLIARERHRPLWAVLLRGLLAAGGLIAVDQIFGSAAYGTVAIIPAVVANAGQSVELVRSPRIVGVSMVFLLLALTNQALWLTWAILVPDAGTVIVACVTGSIAAFNLAWWTLRFRGLRPFLTATSTAPSRPSPRRSARRRLSRDERPREPACMIARTARPRTRGQQRPKIESDSDPDLGRSRQGATVSPCPSRGC